MFGSGWASVLDASCGLAEGLIGENICTEYGIATTEIDLTSSGYLDYDAASWYNLRNHSSASVKNLLHFA